MPFLLQLHCLLAFIAILLSSPVHGEMTRVQKSAWKAFSTKGSLLCFHPRSQQPVAMFLDKDVKDEDLNILAHFPHIEALIIRSPHVGNRGMKWIAMHVPKIRSLTLICTQVGDQGIELLSLCKELESIRIFGARSIQRAICDWNEAEWRLVENCRVSDKSCRVLSQLPRLRTVVVFGYELSSKGLSNLVTIPKLRTLYLDDNRISSAGLPNFSKCANLEAISLARNPVGDIIVSLLNKSPSLSEVRLNGTNITESSIPALREMRKLRKVSIANTRITTKMAVNLEQHMRFVCFLPSESEAPKTSAEYIVFHPDSKVSANYRLSVFLLSITGMAGVSVKDGLVDGVIINEGFPAEAGIFFAKHFRNLDGVIASKSTLNGEDPLKPLTHLKKISMLWLDETNITDSKLQRVADIPGLELLNIEKTMTTDQGIVHLIACRNLKKLSLRDTNVGDASIPHIAKIKTLQHLDLRGTRFTANGIDKLKVLIPTLTVYFDEEIIPKSEQQRGGA